MLYLLQHGADPHILGKSGENFHYSGHFLHTAARQTAGWNKPEMSAILDFLGAELFDFITVDVVYPYCPSHFGAEDHSICPLGLPSAEVLRSGAPYNHSGVLNVFQLLCLREDNHAHVLPLLERFRRHRISDMKIAQLAANALPFARHSGLSSANNLHLVATLTSVAGTCVATPSAIRPVVAAEHIALATPVAESPGRLEVALLGLSIRR